MSTEEEELRAQLEKLKAENESLKASATKELRLQVSAKGGVSLYGLRRFPATFYSDEWEKILSMADEIRAFLQAHAGELKKKGE